MMNVRALQQGGGGVGWNQLTEMENKIILMETYNSTKETYLNSVD